MKNVTPIDRYADPVWYAREIGQDLFVKSQVYGLDYWQEVLLILHEDFAEEELADKYGKRYYTKLERRILHRHFSALAAQFAEPALKEPDDKPLNN